MSRVRFTVLGQHPLLRLVRDYFILKKKFQLTSLASADFVLAGTSDAFFKDSPTLCIPNLPALVLSSDVAYTDRDLRLTVRDKSPMSEHEPSLVPSVLDPVLATIASTLSLESRWIRRGSQTMLLRVFNTYGPDIGCGVVRKFCDEAEIGSPLTIHKPGYHTRTFLHQEDFLEIVSRCVDRFLEGTSGIYNVGSTEEITIVHLAQTVNQLYHRDPKNYVMSKSSRLLRRWKLPDMTRTKAITGYTPKRSLRFSLWADRKSPMSLYEGLDQPKLTG